jgi:hypothetical protein
MAAVRQHVKVALENKQGQEVPDSKVCGGGKSAPKPEPKKSRK